MTKSASVVFFYFGDSYLTTLGQETVPVGLALEGYDRSVLLHHETKIGPFEVSRSDEKHATVVDLPTQENLVRHLADLRESGHRVDLFLFTHGSRGVFRTSLGEDGKSGWASTGWFEQNVPPLDLNAVWQTNCWGSSWNETWTKLGARVVCGTRSVNFYPSRFGPFMRKWAAGRTFEDAAQLSDTGQIRTVSQAFVLAQAMLRLKEWGGDITSAPGALGRTWAAEQYFRKCWLGDDWVEGKSGRENMNLSSSLVFSGDGSVRNLR